MYPDLKSCPTSIFIWRFRIFIKVAKTRQNTHNLQTKQLSKYTNAISKPVTHVKYVCLWLETRIPMDGDYCNKQSVERAKFRQTFKNTVQHAVFATSSVYLTKEKLTKCHSFESQLHQNTIVFSIYGLWRAITLLEAIVINGLLDGLL